KITMYVRCVRRRMQLNEQDDGLTVKQHLVQWVRYPLITLFKMASYLEASCLKFWSASVKLASSMDCALRMYFMQVMAICIRLFYLTLELKVRQNERSRQAPLF